MNKKTPAQPFISAKDEAMERRKHDASLSSAYELAFLDEAFLLREELRPVRLQLELLKPELLQQEQGIDETIVVFGSARIAEHSESQLACQHAEQALAVEPENVSLQQQLNKSRSLLAKSHYYDQARAFGRIVSAAKAQRDDINYVIVTGGGPGIMEGANRGCHDLGEKSIGVSIVLPLEEKPNPYVTPELAFKFHYFALRKMHFLMRARAVVAFPGGFGTLDELFEALTLMQTQKIHRIPILLFGQSYWERIINLDAMVAEGVISAADLQLVTYVETAEAAWHSILDFYQLSH